MKCLFTKTTIEWFFSVWLLLCTVELKEKINVVSLEQLDPNQVDMLTVVLVGSSQTRKFKLPNGDIKVFTPRGYYEKSNLKK